MIRYLAFGERRYGSAPVPATTRRRWELQTALSGRIAPIIPGRTPELRSRRMWILPPTLIHGWTGDAESAEVLVLQPQRVPAPIESAAAEAARRGALLIWDMTDEDVAWLRSEARELLAAYQSPGLVDLMRQELVVAGIAWRALSASAIGGTAGLPAPAARAMVDKAVGWMAEHIGGGFSELRLARALAVSPSHLRRLFHQVGEQPPRAVMQRLRMQEADRLLLTTSMTMEAMAAALGFASSSALGRAYKRTRGRSPGRVRSEPLVANRHPTHRPI